MKTRWNELPRDSHRASEEARRERARRAHKIVKRMGNIGNNGSDHVLVRHMNTGTCHVVTETLIDKVPADSSRPSFIIRSWHI